MTSILRKYFVSFLPDLNMNTDTEQSSGSC